MPKFPFASLKKREAACGETQKGAYIRGKGSLGAVCGSGRRICKATGKGCYRLPDKVVVAGFEGAKEFHEYREAAAAKKYNLSEVTVRILNADRASWNKK